jgi:hypothetical protein
MFRLMVLFTPQNLVSMLMALKLIVLGYTAVHLIKNSIGCSWDDSTLVEIVFAATCVPFYEIYDPGEED